MLHLGGCHLCFAALVASPWFMIGGAALAGCGLLVCGEPEQILSGSTALAAAAGAGKLAWERLWAVAVPATLVQRRR